MLRSKKQNFKTRGVSALANNSPHPHPHSFHATMARFLDCILFSFPTVPSMLKSTASLSRYGKKSPTCSIHRQSFSINKTQVLPPRNAPYIKRTLRELGCAISSRLDMLQIFKYQNIFHAQHCRTNELKNLVCGGLCTQSLPVTSRDVHYLCKKLTLHKICRTLSMRDV